MSVEQNRERNVDDVDDDKGELVRHTSTQEEFAISFTRSPMQFVNVVFSYLQWLAPCFWKNRLTSQDVSIGNVNVFGVDSDDVQFCVNILHQILGSLSRCRVMTSICTVSSENVCEEQHTQVVESCDTQEAYNTVRELSSVILEKLVQCQSSKVMSF